MKHLLQFIFCLSMFAILLSAPLNAITCNDRIAQAPIAVDDPDYGRWLLEQARDHILSVENLKCDPFVDFEKSVDSFDYIGVSFYHNKPSHRYTTKQIRLIKQTFNATYILKAKLHTPTVLSVNIYRIEGDYDLRLEKTKHYEFFIEIKKSKNHQAPQFLKYLSLMSPNSFTLGSTYTEVSMDLPDEYQEIDSTQKSALPKIISSISFNKIDNSYAYNMFDAGASLFPGQFFFGLDQRTKIARRDSPSTDDDAIKTLRVSIYGICPNINALGTIHTPLGATYTSIGYGPCILHKRVDDENPKFSIDLATRFVMGHRVFFTKKYFTFLEFDYLFFNNHLYRSNFAKSRTITRGTLGLGMYVPDAESLFLKGFETLGLY